MLAFKKSSPFIFIFLVLLFNTSLMAQTALTGTVTDPSGAVLPGATVELISRATVATRTAITSDEGVYSFQQMDPGVYRLEVSMIGFKTLVQDRLDISVGITTTYNATLELGDIQEEVIVNAASSMLNTTDASLGQAMSGIQVLNLPSESLDPAGLLSLQAGVTFIPSQADTVGGYSGIVDTDGRTGSVNGARSDQTNITLDGVDVNDPQNGYAFSSALRATQASLQEFRVTTSNYNADLGRSSAAQVQLVTKSGTNSVHGQAYYTHRNEAFAANDFFNNQDGTDRGKLRRHVYGASLGGPVVKDRFFLFGNYERLQHSEEGTVLRDIPSMTWRDGVQMYECENPAECPGGTVQGFQNQHTVPDGWKGLSPAEMAQIDPLGIGPSSGFLDYARQFPVPNATGGFDGVNIQGLRFNTPIDNTYNTFIVRGDVNIDQDGKHTLFTRATVQDDSIVSEPARFPGNPPNQLMLGSSWGLAAGYKTILSPTTINSFRYGFTRIGEQFDGVLDSEYNSIRFIDELHGYDARSSTRDRWLPQHHIRDDLSLIKGDHTLGFGADFRWTRNSRTSNANSFSSFQSNPSWLSETGRKLMPGHSSCVTCEGFPAVAGGFSSSYRDSAVSLLGLMTQIDGYYNFTTAGQLLDIGEPVPRRYAVDEYEVYVQDQWRVKPSLTLTLGVRWGVGTPPRETEGQQVIPVPDLGEWFDTRRSLMESGSAAINAPELAFDLAGPANGAPDFYKTDWNNWSPRLAVAWAPTADEGFLGWLTGGDKLSIRAGYSLVYDRVGNGLATSFDANGSFGLNTILTSAWGGCDEGGGGAPLGPCPRYTTPFDVAPSEILKPAPIGGVFPARPPGIDADGNEEDGNFAISEALDSSLTTAYSHVINVSLQRELPGDFTIEAAYVGRKGRSLLIARDMAMPADLRDPASGTTYFEAAKQLVGLMESGTDINDVGAIPYWENLFPSLGPNGVNGGYLLCGVPPGSDFDTQYSASQVAYDLITCMHPDTTYAPYWLDRGWSGYMACDDQPDLDGDGIGDCPFAFWTPQFGTLNALSSLARSNYDALQISLRKRFSAGLALGFNYTFSHALDHSSQPERAGVTAGDFGGGGYSGSTINAWEIDKEYANADFDTRHQFNGNWFWQIPVGAGRSYGSDMPGWADQIFGGWETSGIIRINAGQVANVINARVWPTNWNLQGNATCAGGPVDDIVYSTKYGPCAPTSNVKNGQDADGNGVGPNMFSNPQDALGTFRYTLPGDRGERNVLRADNYFGLDFSIGKQFSMPWEGHLLKFRWEIFNLTNSAYFDSNSLELDIARSSTFGNYNAILGAPRRMQVSLRYEF